MKLKDAAVLTCLASDCSYNCERMCCAPEVMVGDDYVEYDFRFDEPSPFRNGLGEPEVIGKIFLIDKALEGHPVDRIVFNDKNIQHRFVHRGFPSGEEKENQYISTPRDPSTRARGTRAVELLISIDGAGGPPRPSCREGIENPVACVFSGDDAGEHPA